MAVRITNNCEGTKYTYGGDTTGRRDPRERFVSIAKGRIISGDLWEHDYFDEIEMPNGDLVHIPKGNCVEIPDEVEVLTGEDPNET